MLAGRGISEMRILGIVALGAALGGCASSAADITPAYVSPVAYQSYTCQQLALDAQSISTRAATLSGAQDSQRTKDGWATAAAVVVFWPAAVFRMSRVVRLPFDGSSHFDQSRVRPDGPFQASQSHSRNRAIGFGPW